MINAMWGIVRDGRVEPLEQTTMPEGARVIITLLPDLEEGAHFWNRLSEESLKKIWDNAEDDVYAELLKR